MKVAPSAGRRDLYAALINGLKSDGVWNRLDWLLISAAHDEQAGRINLKAPSKMAIASGGLTFTADRGFSGDGTSASLDLGERQGAPSQYARQDSCSAGVWCNQQGAASGQFGHFAQAASTHRTSILAHSGGNDVIRAADATADVLRAGTTRVGHRAFARSGPANKLGFFNGAQVSTAATPSTGLSSLNMVLLRWNTGSFSPDRIAAAWTGDGSITGAKAAAIHDRLNTFLTAIGAA
ncbi:hypothetical protein LTR94_002225 [Friedmanniomyces endolithicus]|nr:hypothetical protein LTR94_002225 [Friedmanniomyces endolithicus]